MVRVLQIVSSMNVGGLETFIMNIYRNIDRDIIQFDFLVHTEEECFYNEEIRRLGGRIYKVPARNKGIIKNRRELDEFFENYKDYKVVHQHVSSLSYIEPLIVARKYNIPVRIVHGHSTRPPGSSLHKHLHKLNQKRITRVATNYLACSENVAEWLYSKSNVSTNCYKIVNNGIQTTEYIFNESVRNKIRKELKIQDKLVVGHIGRFAYPKNHEFLIEIFKSIHDKDSNSILLLVGDGKLRPGIEEKCELMGIKDHVIFTGIRSDIPNILQAIDVFVFPSHYEGSPVTLLEAQASGLPCIVSSNITEQVNITDLVVNVSLNQSADNWAESIFTNISLNNRDNYAERVRKKGFDCKSIAEDLAEFYMKAIDTTC